ncbi:hypothetical protein CsSME_00004579 [Camellia sinensis var. sinensis]
MELCSMLNQLKAQPIWLLVLLGFVLYHYSNARSLFSTGSTLISSDLPRISRNTGLGHSSPDQPTVSAKVSPFN